MEAQQGSLFIAYRRDSSMHSQSTSLPLTLYMQRGVGGNGRYGRRFVRNGRLTAPTLILLYIVEEGVRVFRLMEVRSWIKERYGIELDRRRIWDGSRVLEERGILEKLRGGFRRVLDIARAIGELARRLNGNNSNDGGTASGCTRGTTDAGARLGSCAGRRVCGSGLVRHGDGCVVVFRDHRRVGRRVDLVGLVEEGVVRAGFLWRMFQLVERAYVGLLRRLGYSGYRVRRLRARARRVFEAVASRAVVRIGAHGREGGGEPGRFYGFEEFVRLVSGNPYPDAKFKEFGVDVVICPGEGFSPEELGELENLVAGLWEIVGSARVYIPLEGRGSRR